MSKNTYSDDEIIIRAARREDMVAVAEMIQELADFEKMSEGPKLTVQDLERDGFDKSPPSFCCLVAEVGGAGVSGYALYFDLERDGFDKSPPSFCCLVAEVGGAGVAGYALYFPTYSTWEGRALMLEDLYVRPAVRRRGVGRRLFDAVAKEACLAGCCRLDFHVLQWNEARQFYERRGAVDLSAADSWRLYRLAGRPLAAAAGRD